MQYWLTTSLTVNKNNKTLLDVYNKCQGNRPSADNAADLREPDIKSEKSEMNWMTFIGVGSVSRLPTFSLEGQSTNEKEHLFLFPRARTAAIVGSNLNFPI